jgi:hypothetical protein
MSIETNFVPCQIAVDMKLLGFDEECLAYYDQWVKNNNEVKQIFRLGNVRGIFGSITPAPTFSQSFKFFRKNYKLHSHISLGISDEQDISGLEYDEYIYVIEGLNGLDYNNYGESPFYKTPEEAETACLIKLIELVTEF